MEGRAGTEICEQGLAGRNEKKRSGRCKEYRSWEECQATRRRSSIQLTDGHGNSGIRGREWQQRGEVGMGREDEKEETKGTTTRPTPTKAKGLVEKEGEESQPSKKSDLKAERKRISSLDYGNFQKKSIQKRETKQDSCASDRKAHIKESSLSLSCGRSKHLVVARRSKLLHTVPACFAAAADVGMRTENNSARFCRFSEL